MKKKNLEWPLKDLDGFEVFFKLIYRNPMIKSTLVFLAMLMISCSKDDVTIDEEIGVVMNITSCGGGLEPVFIIKLGENDFIMASTLPKEFQVPNLSIAFKIKKSTTPLYCTTDKVYPPVFDIFNVRKVAN